MNHDAKMALLSQCPCYQFKPQLQADLDAFLKRNFAVEASVVSISFVGQQKHNVLSLRGKLPIKLQSRTRPVGFKFILPAQYPMIPPYVYLDEPENPQVAELLDYIEKNNRIKNDFLTNWTARNNDPNWKPKLNLSQLLLEVFELFTKAPPLSFEEIFQDEHQIPQPASQSQLNSNAFGWGQQNIPFGGMQVNPDLGRNQWEMLPGLPSKQKENMEEEINPLDNLLKHNEQANADGDYDLVRQQSCYQAKSMVMSIQDEETQKKQLVEQEQTELSEKLEQLYTLQKFSMQPTVLEQEFFSDNQKILKSESHKIECARKAEEEANELLQEFIPKLEATVESLNSIAELTVETVVEKMIQGGPFGEVGHKIIKYQSKEKAIQDAIMALRDNSQLGVEETVKMIRQLSKTQFRNSWKASRLIRYCQTGQ